MVKRLPAVWETRVQSLGWEDPLEKEMTTHSCTLPWKIPWTERLLRAWQATVHGVAKSWTPLSDFTLLYFHFYFQQGFYQKPSLRRDKKAFLNNQCKEIEENNRRGKTRDLFKKVRDIKGTFHAKMGTIKDRNSMDLTEAENIRRGDKNTQKNQTKKIFMTQITMVV